MPTLIINKTYADGDILFEADLDAISDSVETFLNTTKIDDDNIQDGGIDASVKLTAASITEDRIASSAITTTKIADSNVTTAKIADANITTAKILDANVTTAKIADSNVTTAKIADSNVTTAKIANGAITHPKLAQMHTSSVGGNFNTTSSGFVDATNFSVTADFGSGRLCEVSLEIKDMSLEPSALTPAGIITQASSPAVFEIYSFTSSTVLYSTVVPLSSIVRASSIRSKFYLTGTHEIRCRLRLSSGSNAVTISNAYLLLNFI